MSYWSLLPIDWIQSTNWRTNEEQINDLQFERLQQACIFSKKAISITYKLILPILAANTEGDLPIYFQNENNTR